MNTTPNRRSHEDGGNGSGNVGSSGSHSHSSASKYPHEDHGTFSSACGKVAASARQEYHAPYDMGQDARMPKIMPRNESRDVDSRLPLLPNMLFRVSSSSNESLSDHVGSESRLEWRDSKDSGKDIKVENCDVIAEPRDLHQSGKGDYNVKHESQVDDSKDAKHERGDAFPEHEGDINLDKEGLNGSNSRLNWKDFKEHHGKQYPDAPGGSVDLWRSSHTNLHAPVEARKEVPNVEDRDFTEAHEAVGGNNVDLKGDDKFKDRDRKRKVVKHWDWGERERERESERGDRRNNLQLENSSSENKEVLREDRESERWGKEKKDTAKDREKLNDRAKDYVKREVLNGGEKEASHNEKEPMDISGRSAEREDLTLERKKQKDHDSWKKIDRGTRDRKKERDFDIEVERPDKRSRYHEKESEEGGIDNEWSTEREIEAFNSGIQQQKRMLQPRGSPQMGYRAHRFRSRTQDIEGMEYHLNDTVRQIPGKVTSNCNFATFTTVVDMLDEEHADILRRSCLWPLRMLRDIQFSGQLFDALLCRLLKLVDENALRFDLGGKIATFSMFEFALITGLRCTGEEIARARIPKNMRLLNKYFHGQTIVTLTQLGEAFRACNQMSDKLKLGLVLILESVLRCHHRKTSIDLFHLKIVDDIDAFNNYPWGQRCFMDTLRVFRREFSMPKGPRPERKYDAYGLPLALQIWVYETVPILAGRYARRGETCCPRMLHWRAQDKPLAKQISALLDDPELEVLTEMTPSTDEEDQIYLRDLSVPVAPDDRYGECRPVSPPPRRSVSRVSPSSMRSSPIVSPMPSSMPMPSPPSIRPHSSPSRHSPCASPVHDDLYVILSAFTAEIRGEVGALREEVGALRREMREEIYALREEIGVLRRGVSCEVASLRNDVLVLRGHVSDLKGEVAALRGDIGRIRGDDIRSQGDGDRDRERVHSPS